MSEPKAPDRSTEVDRRVANRNPSDPKDSGGSWLSRSGKPGGRHSAITRNLYSFHSYKNWADKVRIDWDDKDRKR